MNNEHITAYPLAWPAGWRRTATHLRERARFNKKEPVWRDGAHAYNRTSDLSVMDSLKRVLKTLEMMGVSNDDVVVSTNLRTRLDGLPRSDQRAPDDPGAAVYWRKINETRCMAIDRYDRVEDNLAAIAATLDALRAIERHGGAAILDRAFQGFTALPAPECWWQILGFKYEDVCRLSKQDIQNKWRELISLHHPDNGGDPEKAARVNRARDEGLEALLR